METTVVRSRRKTMAVEIRPGQVIVRVPMWATREDVQQFLLQHRDWIEAHLKQVQTRQQTLSSVERLTPEELRELGNRALEVIPERVRYYAPLVGVTYGRITIRNQRTRWGSCSAKGNLNFNCLLMLAPPEVLDSVVVHELCHRKEMNHSERFYQEVLRVFPEYHKWHQWLKENGGMLLARMGQAE